MIITKVHIRSFGGLEEFVLEPQGGLNCLNRQNEFGKTTLVHFIYYMLYGYEAKRLKNYFPWSGAPMAGSLEFLHQGELLRIERTRTEKSAGKTRVLDGRTGAELSLPPRCQPGEYFLNLDGETFLRSFCIAQGDLPFGYTDGLDKALKNLAASGDEGVSFEEAVGYLREQRTRYAAWNNRRGGPLDQLQGELSDQRVRLARLEEELSAKETLRKQGEALSEKIRLMEEQADQQRQLLQAARKSDALQVLNQVTALEERQKNAHARPAVSKEQMEETAQAFEGVKTAKTTLEQAEKEWDESRVRLEQIDERLLLLGCNAATGAELESARKKGSALPLILLIAGLLLLGASLWAGTSLLILGLACISVGIALIVTEKNRKNTLFQRYGVGCLAQLEQKWAQYQALWAERERLYAEREARRGAADTAKAVLTAAEEKLARLQDATGIGSLAKLEDLRVDWRVFEGGSDPALLENQVRTLLRGIPRAEWELLARDATPISETAETVALRLQALNEEIARLRKERDALDVGDPARLWQERQELVQSIANHEQAYEQGRAELAALDKSLDWLREANEEMNTQFSPKLCAAAGQYLQTLTQGKYSGLKMDNAFRLRLEAPDGTYEAERFSAGTRDAVYFAFRLAAADLLAEGLPLILDDPFVNLDTARLESAMALLERAAQTRQILYFSCRE